MEPQAWTDEDKKLAKTILYTYLDSMDLTEMEEMKFLQLYGWTIGLEDLPFPVWMSRIDNWVTKKGEK